MKLFEINKDIALFEVLKEDEYNKIVHLSIKKGKEVPKHNSEHLAIVVCLSGTVEFTNFEETIILENGKFVILEPKEEHALFAKSDCEVLVIQQKIK